METDWHWYPFEPCVLPTLSIPSMNGLEYVRKHRGREDRESGVGVYFQVEGGFSMGF